MKPLYLKIGLLIILLCIYIYMLWKRFEKAPTRYLLQPRTVINILNYENDIIISIINVSDVRLIWIQAICQNGYLILRLQDRWNCQHCNMSLNSLEAAQCFWLMSMAPWNPSYQAGLLRTQTVAWFSVKCATVELTSFARKVCYLL